MHGTRRPEPIESLHPSVAAALPGAATCVSGAQQRPRRLVGTPGPAPGALSPAARPAVSGRRPAGYAPPGPDPTPGSRRACRRPPPHPADGPARPRGRSHAAGSSRSGAAGSRGRCCGWPGKERVRGWSACWPACAPDGRRGAGCACADETHSHLHPAWAGNGRRTRPRDGPPAISGIGCSLAADWPALTPWSASPWRAAASTVGGAISATAHPTGPFLAHPASPLPADGPCRPLQSPQLLPFQPSPRQHP